MNLALLAPAVILLVFIDNIWLQMLNAVFWAFVFVQMGYIMHDAGHRQIFQAIRGNDVIGLIYSNLLAGVSYNYWMARHNQHHSHPNHLENDPDINVPLLAFSEEQVRRKQGILRSLLKFQAFYFIPLSLLQAYNLKFRTIGFVAHNLRQSRIKYVKTEALFLITHYVLYFGILFYVLGIRQALIFHIVHFAFTGLYMAMVFAPNHKGMPMIDDNSDLDFLRRQVLTARNIKPHPLTDFLYGGLNYQIEHHLFPNLPRNKLREAQDIVRAFCESKSVSYHETGVLESNIEILQHLHKIAAPLRTGQASQINSVET